MTEAQRVEYKSIELNALEFDDVGEQRIDEMAKEGWQLVENVEIDGTTVYFIFERPV